MWDVSGVINQWWPDECPAFVERVVDGDTIVALLVMDGRFIRWRVRLHGIDTPELRGGTDDTKRQAQDCKELLRERVEGQGVWLQIRGADNFGRLVARVHWAPHLAPNCRFCPDDAVDVCSWMLSHGPGTVPFMVDSD